MSILSKISLWEIDEICILGDFDKVDFIFPLSIVLLIFEYSADVDGWMKLIKRKERNITFFDKPEINFRI